MDELDEMRAQMAAVGSEEELYRLVEEWHERETEWEDFSVLYEEALEHPLLSPKTWSLLASLGTKGVFDVPMLESWVWSDPTFFDQEQVQPLRTLFKHVGAADLLSRGWLLGALLYSDAGCATMAGMTGFPGELYRVMEEKFRGTESRSNLTAGEGRLLKNKDVPVDIRVRLAVLSPRDAGAMEDIPEAVAEALVEAAMTAKKQESLVLWPDVIEGLCRRKDVAWTAISRLLDNRGKLYRYAFSSPNIPLDVLREEVSVLDSLRKSTSSRLEMEHHDHVSRSMARNVRLPGDVAKKILVWGETIPLMFLAGNSATPGDVLYELCQSKNRDIAETALKEVEVRKAMGR
jgi:hypothetical protein